MMRLQNCFNKIMEKGVTLLYGVAGSGKTALSLEAVKARCRRLKCIYITTEGLDFLKRADKIGVRLENLLVTEAFDLADLVSAAEYAVSILAREQVGLVVVDSVNAPFRAEAGSPPALAQEMYVAALLKASSDEYGIPVIVTGQVHEVNGVLEAVGLSAISPWVDRIARVERTMSQNRRLVFERGSSCECEFEITGWGIRWL